MILYREIKCVESDEMCGVWKLSYKILDKNLTIVFLYREVNCVENDENVRILKVKLQNIG